MSSRAYEAGVEGTGEGYIGSALNKGAAVGEKGNGVGRPLEAEEEIVEADSAVGGEAISHGVEVDGAMMLVDLDGVAATEGDVRAAFSGEMGEDAVTANSAGRDRLSGVYFAAGICPEVEGQKGSADKVRLAGEELEGLGDLDGGGEIDGSIKDAGGVAGFDRAGRGLGEDAGEAGGRG